MQGRRGGKVRVAVLFGGQSGEHDVSLRSAQTVMGALDPARYEVIPVGITREGRWLTGGDPFAALTATSPLFALGDGSAPVAPPAESAPAESGVPAIFSAGVDVVFPVLHGPMGEDGTVQGFLELTGIPYVGAGVLGSSLSMDKAMAKTVLAQAGLPQAPWRLVTRKEWERDPEAVTDWVGESLGYPCFVKPANMGSSVGVVKAHDPSEMPSAMRQACRFDRRIVIEQGVDARELEISVLGNDEPIASIVGEVIPSNEFYDYDAKYVDDRSELLVPAPIGGDTMTQIQELAIAAFRALDLAGMARVDFFMERNTDQIFINEVNTIPGFTAISMYPRLWAASGVPLPELVDRLVGLALERSLERRRAL
ncbi:MAG: D-alanine--D-alanine ligase [Thermomicrobiales bacterium]|nr:D-alanine--D-alanine ligase [Thermomicrobiales bacterium]